jgi:hypothetical protein
MSDRLNFWNRKSPQVNPTPEPIPDPPPAPAIQSPAPVSPPRAEPKPKKDPRRPGATTADQPLPRPALRRRLGLKPSQVRTYYISVALSEEEREYLNAYCDRYQIALSGWLREIALYAARRPPVASAPSRNRTTRLKRKQP